MEGEFEEYLLVEGVNPSTLQARVNVQNGKGDWRLWGQPFVAGDMCCQAMILPKKGDVQKEEAKTRWGEGR